MMPMWGWEEQLHETEERIQIMRSKRDLSKSASYDSATTSTPTHNTQQHAVRWSSWHAGDVSERSEGSFLSSRDLSKCSITPPASTDPGDYERTARIFQTSNCIPSGAGPWAAPFATLRPLPNLAEVSRVQAQGATQPPEAPPRRPPRASQGGAPNPVTHLPQSASAAPVLLEPHQRPNQDPPTQRLPGGEPHVQQKSLQGSTHSLANTAPPNFYTSTRWSSRNSSQSSELPQPSTQQQEACCTAGTQTYPTFDRVQPVTQGLPGKSQSSGYIIDALLAEVQNLKAQVELGKEREESLHRHIAALARERDSIQMLWEGERKRQLLLQEAMSCTLRSASSDLAARLGRSQA